jgi:hypothetical protein
MPLRPTQIQPQAVNQDLPGEEPVTALRRLSCSPIET